MAKRKHRKKKKVSVSTILAVLVFIAGLGLVAYPTVSDWWNRYNSVKMIEAYERLVDEASEQEKRDMFKAADEYNASLIDNAQRFAMSKEQRSVYNSILNLGDLGIIGHIEIETLGVKIPIYHGTSDKVLDMAVGHVEGSSLPVGGKGTHAVISGHRGLPSAKLFTDLDKMSEGDRFKITVMDRELWYQVDQVRIVLPDDMSELRIDPNEDWCTLVTCTPYGVNTHRLLVRGHRISTADIVEIPADGVQIPNYVAILAVGIPMLFVYLVFALAKYRVIEYNRYDKQKILEQLRKEIEQERPVDSETDSDVESKTETISDASLDIQNGNIRKHVQNRYSSGRYGRLSRLHLHKQLRSRRNRAYRRRRK